MPWVLAALGSVGSALGAGAGAAGGALGSAAGTVGGALGEAGSALGVGQAGVPALAGVSQAAAPAATSAAPVLGGLGAPATSGLIGTGGQLGLGGILPQFGIGLGQGGLGFPPAQAGGFSPQNLGYALGTLARGSQGGGGDSGQQVAVLMQLLDQLRRQGVA